MMEHCYYTCYQQLRELLTAYTEEFHLANCKASELVHQYFLCVEVDIDTDIPATCWLSTWWDWSNINIWGAYGWCIPDIKVIWYSIETQSGKASDTVTVVVQCDGSQGDSCGEYEQQLFTTPTTPHIIVSGLVLLLSKVGVSQFELCSITVDVVFWTQIFWKVTRWIHPTVGTDTLSSDDRAIMIGILWWVNLAKSSKCCTCIYAGVITQRSCHTYNTSSSS